MPSLFLTAAWKKLLMANYPVDASALRPLVPARTELDVWHGDPYVSLVGFQFRDVRVRGMRVPFHTRFPEVNLRFYVRFKEEGIWKRGVVFVREILADYMGPLLRICAGASRNPCFWPWGRR
jgi:uncharacterized protein YqjF (DUF2071 family)